jgi:hypothetical protein
MCDHLFAGCLILLFRLCHHGHGHGHGWSLKVQKWDALARLSWVPYDETAVAKFVWTVQLTPTKDNQRIMILFRKLVEHLLASKIHLRSQNLM